MSTTVARLEAVLSAHTHDFDRAMDKSETKMHKVGKVATTAGLAIAGGLAFGLERSVKAALHAQVSQNRLEQSFKNAHLVMGPYIKSIEAAEKAGRKLGFADEDTKTALGSLITATGSYTKASKELAVAQDVARFKHVELTDATKMLTMAQTGSQRAAKQLGITVPAISAAYDALSKNASAAEKAQAKVTDKMATGDAVIQAVRDHVSGQADAYSKTAAGGMEQFRAQLDHLEVSMGKGLLPILAQVAAAMARGTEYFSKHAAQTKILVGALAALAAALLAVKIQQLAVNLAVLANPYVLATVAIIGMSAALFTLWNRSKQARTIIEIVTGVITMGLAPAIIETVRHWNDLTAAMGSAAKAMSGAISAAVQGLNAGIHGMVRALQKVVGLFKWIIDKAGGVAGAVGGIAGAVGGAVGSVTGRLNPNGEGGPAPPAGARGPVGGNMGQIVGTANAIDSRHFPYLWGGGHSGSTYNGPYDCSGAVSALLRSAGLMSGSMVSGDFMSYGKPGMGKHISILANPEHVYTLINGKAWGTSGQNPGGGAGWFSGGVRSGFTIRHPEGFDSGGIVGGPRGKAKLAVVHGGETILPTHKGFDAASSWQSRYLNFMERTWQFVRPFFPNALGGMPPVKFTSGPDSLFVGTDFTPDAHNRIPRPGSRMVYWPKWLPLVGAAAGSGMQDAARQTLIHEWAHEFQNVNATKGIRLGEGGATAFAHLIAPKVYQAMGVDYHDPGAGPIYGPFMRWVMKNKGLDWITKGQFGIFDKGGWLQPGLTLAMNNTGRPERVGGGGGDTHFHFPNYVGSKQELMGLLRDAAAQFQNRNGRPMLGT